MKGLNLKRFCKILAFNANQLQSKSIDKANQLTGFYMSATLAFNELLMFFCFFTMHASYIRPTNFYWLLNHVCPPTYLFINRKILSFSLISFSRNLTNMMQSVGMSEVSLLFFFFFFFKSVYFFFFFSCKANQLTKQIN